MVGINYVFRAKKGMCEFDFIEKDRVGAGSFVSNCLGVSLDWVMRYKCEIRLNPYEGLAKLGYVSPIFWNLVRPSFNCIFSNKIYNIEATRIISLVLHICNFIRKKGRKHIGCVMFNYRC